MLHPPRLTSMIIPVLLALLVGAVSNAPYARAADELLEDVLQDNGHAPWFDADTNEPQPVPLEPDPVEAPHRKSDREMNAPQAPSLPDFEFPTWIGSLLWWITWTLLGLLLAVIIFFIVRALMKPRPSLPEAPPGESWDPARIEDLPFELAAAPNDFMAAARVAFDNNDLRLAMILLFSEQLMHLDRKHWIRLAKGKTNRQYLRELRADPELRATMRKSVWTFERIYFGGEEPERAEVEQMWSDTIELKERYQQPAEIEVVPV